MKITIVENELYLAQSIAAKLNEKGFETETYSGVKEAIGSDADVFLLSTNLPGQNPAPLISKHKEKIIILMVNYINNDTVGEPLKLGAKDYIVKPFMIEELLRKIEHFKEYQTLKRKNALYESYLQEVFQEIEIKNEHLDAITPPIVIETNYERFVDKAVFEYAFKKEMSLFFISIGQKNWLDTLLGAPKNVLLYITHAHLLKKSEKEKLFDALQDKMFIISTKSPIDSQYPSIQLNTDSKLYDQNEILTIDDYVKYVVTTFQYKFPDTELSKKLGISRKSLWEKRRKYGLIKKK